MNQPFKAKAHETEIRRWPTFTPPQRAAHAALCGLFLLRRSYFRKMGDEKAATFIEEYADYLEAHIEEWTTTTKGSLVEGSSTYYMRILPEKVGQQNPAEDKESRVLHIKNHAPGDQADYPARDIVDGGFLELVRYGIRRPDDPVILATVKVIDAVLKVNTPAGPAWHRYNHDGYGQGKDGAPFTSYGVGRVWPLLTGERGHYELAAGHSTDEYIRTMESLASKTGLLPEQSWDEADRPDIHMWLGKPTGSAMPLMWAHAEYIKLLRSTTDGQVYDTIPEVASRYLGKRPARKLLEIWKPNRHVRFMNINETLRIHGEAAFTLHWSADEWKTATDTESTATSLQIDFVDLTEVVLHAGMTIRFTFLWASDGRWEGQDYGVSVLAVPD